MTYRLTAPMRYFPYVVEAPPMPDQYSWQRKISFAPKVYDGSVFRIYDCNGQLRKGLPLFAYPPLNSAYSGFKGTSCNCSYR